MPPQPEAVARWWTVAIAPILTFMTGAGLLVYGATHDSGDSLAAATVLLTASGAQTAHKILKSGPE